MNVHALKGKTICVGHRRPYRDLAHDRKCARHWSGLGLSKTQIDWNIKIKSMKNHERSPIKTEGVF